MINAAFIWLSNGLVNRRPFIVAPTPRGYDETPTFILKILDTLFYSYVQNVSKRISCIARKDFWNVLQRPNEFLLRVCKLHEFVFMFFVLWCMICLQQRNRNIKHFMLFMNIQIYSCKTLGRRTHLKSQHHQVECTGKIVWKILHKQFLLWKWNYLK